jgi:putative endonuclease
LWYVYFLELNDGDIYGTVVSTRTNLPAILRSYVATSDETNARRLEKYFKSGSGKAFARKRSLAKDRP